MRLHRDTFLEKCDDGYLVYAPLLNAAFTVNASAAEYIQTLINGTNDEVPPRFQELYSFMDGLGLFSPDVPERQLPVMSQDGIFQPTATYLLLTANCNMRCGYCFSHGGDSTKNLSLNIAMAACDLVIRNAAQLNVPARIRFHGGGEPTLNWRVLTEVTYHFKRSAELAGVQSMIGINTNGIFSVSKLDWLADNMDEIFISFDGPPDVQNLQRPIRGSGDSFSIVWTTMKMLAKRGKSFAVRSTITAGNCGRMTELVEMLQQFNVKGVELEPLSVCGRANEYPVMAPRPEEYVEGYKKAFERGREIGVSVFNSSARLDGLSSTFCGAAGKNLAISPDGNATFCHRVTDIEEPGAKSFIYGSYSEDHGTFELNEQTIAGMKSLHCEDSPACNTCFAKWNCAGGCYAQNTVETGSLLLNERSDRCEITRGLIKFTLEDAIRNER